MILAMIFALLIEGVRYPYHTNGTLTVLLVCNRCLSNILLLRCELLRVDPSVEDRRWEFCFSGSANAIFYYFYTLWKSPY